MKIFTKLNFSCITSNKNLKFWVSHGRNIREFEELTIIAILPFAMASLYLVIAVATKFFEIASDLPAAE